MNRTGEPQGRLKYDRSVFRVIVLAGVLLVFATSITGILSFRITQNEVMNKLKTNDLVRTAKSIGSQVEARIDRAVETSLGLAMDPSVTEWLSGGEKDEKLGDIVRMQLVNLQHSFDYTNSFVVSAVTNQYWAENGEVLERVNQDDPDDQWFFDTLASGKRTAVVVDSNKSRQDTFVFVNVLIGDPNDPLGVAGVGMSLKALSEEFVAYKYGQQSHVWMVGSDGTIHLSDTFAQTGAKIGDYLPEKTVSRLQDAMPGERLILETDNNEGRRVDMISYPLRSAEMRVIAQIPRNETVGFLDSIKLNTAIAVIVSIVLIVFFFIYISRKLADPYKRAISLNEELESKVRARTKELAERNKEMTDSILYANRIQQSVLPADERLESSFSEYFAVWKPRDVVGGDFYWLRKVGDVQWVAVGDCTGHGVPGALMTMLSVSLLDRIADSGEHDSPAAVLGKLNVLLKETLHQMEQDGLSDDGLDLGLMFIMDDRAVYAGTGVTLAVGDESGMHSIKGDKRKIGYRRTPVDIAYTDHVFEADAGRVFYLITDGIVDQNGAGSTASLGRTRLLDWLARQRTAPLAVQREQFELTLSAYMQEESQRDDMTLLAFKPNV
ncbi:SpoIIE family protein phosphatase [Cohnella panacarvi]|uniref:SpoIIE family protein phosphatase n=1 Tax=Cohnella panacarvi TaxID=400776 RepID=UPI00047A4A3F|nr:SpoIIE family protein phosphatase [Cohnella panacarvi]